MIDEAGGPAAPRRRPVPVASPAMTATVAADSSARAHALIDDLFGPPDRAADRAAAVLHAHAAALAWVRETTGAYPAPDTVAARLAEAAQRLKGDDDRDPVTVLGHVAVEGLAAHRSSFAA
jgi:hypothetical protein